MTNQNAVSKTLAILGTIGLGLPLIAPIIFSGILFSRTGRFSIDYLMPAEVFPLVLAGSLLLLWAAIRTHTLVKWIAWILGAGVFLLFASQILAIVTGLASGDIPDTGWQMRLTLGGIIGYDLAVMALFIIGCLLLKKLFSRIETRQ